MIFKIFPCDVNKRPLIEGWQEKATSDPAQIKLWQELYRDRLALFGIPTGPSNDLLVLDIDVKQDNGFESLKSYQVPLTMSQRTRSGGAHLLFKYPKDGKRYGNRVKFAKGLDIRGDGGYICFYGTDASPIAEPPMWLMEECLKQPQPVGTPYAVVPEIAQGIIQTCLQAIHDAPIGERNNTLNREAFRMGQLVSSGSITREHADEILTQAAKSIGLESHEIRGTINSGIGGGHAKPMTVPFGPPPTIEMSLPPPPTVERWTPPYMTMDDLLNTSYLKRPQLFENWSTEDVHITVADGGSGKSTMKLYEAICLALGTPFLGFPCKQQGKTLYITGEDSEKKLAAMIGQMLKQMGIINDLAKVDQVLKSIVIKKDDDLCLVTKDRQGFLTANSLAMSKVVEAVKEINPKMVVIDPIASFWGSESALNDMGKAVSKFVSKLSNDFGICVEMINHAGKESSKSKDDTQFAGRGGTALVSHSRVSRVLRTVDADEFLEMTGNSLAENQTAIHCVVNKFTDGSPLFRKPFLIIREGYLFSRMSLDSSKVMEEKQSIGDGERVFNFIKDVRSQKKYPTKGVILAHFMSIADRISEARVKRALELLDFVGHGDRKIKRIPNPDASLKDEAYVIIKHDGTEV